MEKDLHVLVIENFSPAHEMLLSKNNIDVSWFGESDRLNNREGYFRKVGIGEDAPVEEWIKWAETLNDIKPIDLVLNFHEHRQVEASMIASKLGHAYTNSLETINIVNDKFLMRKYLRDVNIDKTNSMISNNIEELMFFLEGTNNQSAIIKPVNGRASENICLVKSREDLITALTHYKGLDVLIEEYIDGPEYSVECISHRGVHKIIGITEKYKDPDTFVELGHTFPAQLNIETDIKIKDFVTRVLTKLGVMNGPTHTEIILNQNEPRIIETHLRLGGDKITELIKNVLNLDMLELWVNCLIDDHFNIDFELTLKKEFSSIYFKHSQIIGTIKEVDLPKATHKMVRDIKLYKNVGDHIVKTSNSFDRLAHVITTGRDPVVTVGIAKNTIEKIKYGVDENENI